MINKSYPKQLELKRNIVSPLDHPDVVNAVNICVITYIRDAELNLFTLQRLQLHLTHIVITTTC
jgi:putative ribosome biogenesis GTPase RsgA